MVVSDASSHCKTRQAAIRITGTILGESDHCGVRGCAPGVVGIVKLPPHAAGRAQAAC